MTPETIPTEAVITHWPQLKQSTGRLLPAASWAEWFDVLSTPGPWLADNHPGWSAGSFDKNKRKKAACEFLSALVLDLDPPSGDPAIWAPWFGLIHTTKRHTPEVPRFRVILPLSRRATPGEYERIWKHFERYAQARGVQIDRSTKDPSRFWYYPNASEHFESQRLAGALLDVDAVLEAIADETRVVNIRTGEPVPRRGAEVEARARAYIAAMPRSVSGQGGHNALWLACLAVVRGFAIPVESARPIILEWNRSCSPPWSEADIEHKLADADKATNPLGYLLVDRPKRVRMLLDGDIESDIERAAIAAEGSGSDLEITAVELAEDGWKAFCETDARGRIKPTGATAIAIATRHPTLDGALEWDALQDVPMWRIARPWPGGRGPLTEHDATEFMVWCSLRAGVQGIGKNMAWDALIHAARTRTVDPLRSWLTGLRWDGQPRIDTWLGEVTGNPFGARVCTIGRLFALSAVARALEPGCKVDTILILEGQQGIRKSTMIKALFGAEWTKDTPIDLSSKDRFTALRGVWGYELAEFDSWTKHDESRVKQFLSSPCDSYRAPYGRTDATHPRRCVFVGSTNRHDYLKDRTGGRRFWPVRAHSVSVKWVEENRAQLWAEAVHVWRSEEGRPRTDASRWWPDETEARVFADAVDSRVEDDALVPTIATWLEGRDEVRLCDVLAWGLGLDVQHRTMAIQQRASAALTHLGWESVRRRIDGAPMRVWRKCQEKNRSEDG